MARMVGNGEPRLPRLAGATARARPHSPDGREHLPPDVRFATEAEASTDKTEEDAASATLADFQKVVFSSTLQDPLPWANTRLVSGDAVEAVRTMKDHGTEPMRTLGSSSLCRSLLDADLVDRFRVVVFPVITGATGQEPIYDEYPDVSLELLDSRTFEGGLQLLDYVPTVLDGPPARAGAPDGRGGPPTAAGCETRLAVCRAWSAMAATWRQENGTSAGKHSAPHRSGTFVQPPRPDGRHRDGRPAVVGGASNCDCRPYATAGTGALHEHRLLLGS